MAIQPRPEQLAAFAAGAPKQGPLHMLNLLEFKAKAEYADGRDTELTGAEAYGIYGQGVIPLVEKLGGRPLYFGKANTLLIGDGDLEWDAVAIVEYPSLAAFQQMTQSAEYAEIHVHREAGLAHQQLIHCLAAPPA